MKTIKKSLLKEKDSYYYECNDWYSKVPEKLTVSNFKTEIFPRSMTHREILKEYSVIPYNSYAEAVAICASVIPTLKNDYEGRIIYFKENEILYRFCAWRGGDGQLRVGVSRVHLGGECGAGNGVCFSNGNLDTSEKTLSNLDSLTLEKAIEICKENNLTVTKVY